MASLLPPEPILPTEFTIHLYNPDQKIVVRHKPKTWNSAATWEFEMPQRTFRQPSSSSLDRTQTDPSVADVTPKLKFNWRKDGKLSKDMTCFMSGKTSTIPEAKTKNKEPDIIVSMFKGLRELTMYEPNLYRVEMEDFKGLEVVLLLGVVAIRDVFFTPMKDAFRISHATARKPVAASAPAPVPTPAPIQAPVALTNTPPAALFSSNEKGKHRSEPALSGGLNANARPTGQGQGQGPRPQGQQRPQGLQGQQRPQGPPTTKQAPPSKAEEKQTKKLLEAEENARRKKKAEKQAEIDKETKRLQQIYGREEQQVRSAQQQPRPTPPPRPQQQQASSRPMRNSAAHDQRYYHYHSPSVPHMGPSPYMASPGHDARWKSAVRFAPQPETIPVSSGAKPVAATKPAATKPAQLHQKKSSFFGFRKNSNDEAKLAKKRSSMF
ncbi:hypothetical protein AWENTII_011440 [Aspergillus wentii]